MLGACSLRGPEGVELAPDTYLKLSREVIFLPPEQTAKLVERPGARLLGAVLTMDDTPRMMVLYDGGVDERGRRKVEFVGWDEAPPGTYLATQRE